MRNETEERSRTDSPDVELVSTAEPPYMPSQTASRQSLADQDKAYGLINGKKGVNSPTTHLGYIVFFGETFLANELLQ